MQPKMYEESTHLILVQAGWFEKVIIGVESKVADDGVEKEKDIVPADEVTDGLDILERMAAAVDNLG